MVAVIGSRDSIADVGEQLAWMGSSLRFFPAHPGPVLCIAEAQQVHARKAHSTTNAPAFVELFFRIQFRAEIPEDQQHSSPTNGKCWHDLFLNPVIAMGFPIPSRDEVHTGLEIPLYTMATLAQAKRVTMFDGKLYTKGFSTVLFPTKRHGDTILWHLLYNNKGERLTYNDFRIDQLRDSTVDGITMNELQCSRHILGWTSSAEIVVGKQQDFILTNGIALIDIRTCRDH
jgi:hypothetical protein